MLFTSAAPTEVLFSEKWELGGSSFNASWSAGFLAAEFEASFLHSSCDWMVIPFQHVDSIPVFYYCRTMDFDGYDML